MRHIGTLPEGRQAQIFQDYALTLGIKSRIEQEPEGWAVWIFDEDAVTRAKQELDKFAARPDDPLYREASDAAAHLRETEAQKVEQARKNMVNVRERWNRPLAARAPVTFVLMAVSIFVAVSTQLGDHSEPLVRQLMILPFDDTGRFTVSLSEVMASGQVWRVVTPIFLHFTFLHILFNMLMLVQLGGVVETRIGSWRMLLMVLAIAVISNVGQYLQAGPAFGGMSGVVYGLFGYVWMKSKFDPMAGFYVPPNAVIWLIGWFLLGVADIIPGMANTAHGAGLVTGMAIGYLPTLVRR